MHRDPLPSGAMTKIHTALLLVLLMVSASALPVSADHIVDPVHVDVQAGGGGTAMSQAKCDIVGSVCAGTVAVAFDTCLTASGSGILAVFPASADFKLCFSFGQAMSGTHVCDLPLSHRHWEGTVYSPDADESAMYAETAHSISPLICTTETRLAAIAVSEQNCIFADAYSSAMHAILVEAEAMAENSACSDEDPAGVDLSSLDIGPEGDPDRIISTTQLSEENASALRETVESIVTSRVENVTDSWEHGPEGLQEIRKEFIRKIQDDLEDTEIRIGVYETE